MTSSNPHITELDAVALRQKQLLKRVTLALRAQMVFATLATAVSLGVIAIGIRANSQRVEWEQRAEAAKILKRNLEEQTQSVRIERDRLASEK